MFNLDLEKAEEPEIKLRTCVGPKQMQDNFKISNYASLTMQKLCGSQQTVENS